MGIEKKAEDKNKTEQSSVGDSCCSGTTCCDSKSVTDTKVSSGKGKEGKALKKIEDLPEEKKGVIKVKDDDDFEEIVSFAKEKGIPVLIDFSATWCGPCKALKPDFEKLATSEKYNGFILFVEVDVDKCSETAENLKAVALPTIVFLDANGEEDQEKRLAMTKIDETVIEEKILSNL